LTGFLVIVRIYPALTLPAIGDEGSDMFILARDRLSFFSFFSDSITFGFDQARFSHLLAAPLLVVFGSHGLPAVRVLTLVFHLGYLVASLRLIRIIIGNKSAYIYIFLLIMNCFLASYSVFAMTTGESVYMLFHILSILIFYNSFSSAMENGGIFKDYLLLSLMLGLCIASKLFGLLLLLSFILFHWIYMKNIKELSITSFSPLLIGTISGGFFLIITGVNIIPVNPAIKSIISVSVSLIYLVIFVTLTFKEKKQTVPKKMSPVFFWLLLVFVAFTLVLVFSPVYLNLKNILNAMNWFDLWNAGEMPDSNFVDGLVIIAVKFGIIPTVCLFLVVCMGLYYYRTEKNKKPSSVYLPVLLSIITVIHVFIICLSKWKFPWHSLAIFPFLYLPFVLLWAYSSKKKKKKLGIVVAIFLTVVLCDNMYRYISWYPYGHLDGAQYGDEFIGVSKPCLISFELIPEVTNFLASNHTKQRSHYSQVNIQVSRLAVLNSYFNSMLKMYARPNNLRGFFVIEDIDRNNSDYVLTSPIYNAELEKKLAGLHYIKLKTFYIKKIPAATFWAKKSS